LFLRTSSSSGVRLLLKKSAMPFAFNPDSIVTPSFCTSKNVIGIDGDLGSTDFGRVVVVLILYPVPFNP